MTEYSKGYEQKTKRHVVPADDSSRDRVGEVEGFIRDVDAEFFAGFKFVGDDGKVLVEESYFGDLRIERKTLLNEGQRQEVYMVSRCMGQVPKRDSSYQEEARV